MLLLPAILIAAVSNLDNLGVGVALGIAGARITATRNLIVAAVTMAGTAVAMSSGRALSTLIPADVAAVIGSLIIIGIGVGTILASLFAVLAPTGRPIPRLGFVRGLGEGDANLSYREALVLGVALSLNNIGAGIGAGAAGVPPLATALLAGAFSLLSVGGGSSAARSLGRLVARDAAQLMSGLVLLALGGAMASGAL